MDEFEGGGLVGEMGQGRMMEPDAILEHLRAALGAEEAPREARGDDARDDREADRPG